MLVFFGDIYCRYCSHLGQRSQLNWLLCSFYPPRSCRFVVDNLMVSLDWEVAQYFCWVIFSYLCWLLWYRGMYFSINQCSSSKRTWMHLQTLSWRSRYFVGKETIAFWYDVVNGLFFDTSDSTCIIIFNIEDMFFDKFGGDCLFLDKVRIF